MFPKKTKQFSQKLIASAWELGSGFHRMLFILLKDLVGLMNDTQPLYPPNIPQNDIEELKGTNG